MAPESRKAKRKDPSSPKETLKTAERPIDGVLVQLIPGEGNAQTLEVQVLGDVKPFEAPAVLRLAAQNAERQLGIG